jgi:hypothetical protein
MSIMSKHFKSHPSPSSHLKSASVDIFDEVVKGLKMIKCTEIRTQVISYAMIFTGLSSIPSRTPAGVLRYKVADVGLSQP